MEERMRSSSSISVFRFVVYLACLTPRPNTNPLGFQLSPQKISAFPHLNRNLKRWSTTQAEIDSDIPPQPSDTIKEQKAAPLEVSDPSTDSIDDAKSLVAASDKAMETGQTEIDSNTSPQPSDTIMEQKTAPLEVSDPSTDSIDDAKSLVAASDKAMETGQEWWVDAPEEKADSPPSVNTTGEQGTGSLELSDSVSDGIEENASNLMAVSDEVVEDIITPKEYFKGSEWKVGIMWKDNKNIQETWIRCKEEFDCEWGTGGKEGTWDVDGKIFTFTRDYVGGWNGKRIFSAPLRDRNSEVYLEGLVRGWAPFTPAEVMGQWQAIRLGVDRSEYDDPIWMTREDDAELDFEASSSMPEEPFWAGIGDLTKNIFKSPDDTNS